MKDVSKENDWVCQKTKTDAIFISFLFRHEQLPQQQFEYFKTKKISLVLKINKYASVFVFWQTQSFTVETSFMFCHRQNKIKPLHLNQTCVHFSDLVNFIQVVAEFVGCSTTEKYLSSFVKKFKQLRKKIQATLENSSAEKVELSLSALGQRLRLFSTKTAPEFLLTRD